MYVSSVLMTHEAVLGVSWSAEACTFGALVNQTRRSYTDLTCPSGILEAYTFGCINLSKNYFANGIRPSLLSAASVDWIVSAKVIGEEALTRMTLEPIAILNCDGKK